MEQELLKFAILLRKKSNKLTEILELTKQLQEVVSRNDGESMKLILRMRRDTMLEASEIDYIIDDAKKEMSEDVSKEVKRQMSMDFAPIYARKKSPHDYKIYEIYFSMRRCLDNIDKINGLLMKKIEYTTQNTNA